MPDTPPTHGRHQTLSRIGTTVGLLVLTSVSVAAAATGSSSLAVPAVLVCPFAYMLGAAAEHDLPAMPFPCVAAPGADPSPGPAPERGRDPQPAAPPPIPFGAAITPPATPTGRRITGRTLPPWRTSCLTSQPAPCRFRPQ